MILPIESYYYVIGSSDIRQNAEFLFYYENCVKIGGYGITVYLFMELLTCSAQHQCQNRPYGQAKNLVFASIML